jgi:L-amino acid N-acyltransferase YncA
MRIEKMEYGHWLAVKRIYEEGLATGNASFETRSPSWEEWDKAHVPEARLVALENDQVLGWAALTPVSGRCVYAGVGEVSVYVDRDSRGQGIGSKLLARLIAESEKNNYWTLQAGIFPENGASVHLHLESGFRVVGTREKIGRMDNRWRDVLLLEKRSLRAGTD